MRAYILLSCLVILSLSLPGTVGFTHIDKTAKSNLPEAGLGNARLELLSRHNGTINAVALSGNFAYIDFDGRLAVVDISDKANPQIVGQSEVLFNAATDIQLSGSYAYITAGTKGLFIVNITSPSAPYKVGHLPPTVAGSTWDAKSVAIKGSYAYIAAYQEGVRVINISNPANPSEVNSYKDGSDAAEDIAIDGDFAFVAYTSNGMVVLDLGTPSNPTLEGTYLEAGWYPTQVAVYGNYAYLAGYSVSPTKWRLRVINVTTPASPAYTGQTTEIDYEIYDLIYAEGAVWVTHLNMYKILVTNPANPTWNYGYDAKSEATVGIALSGTYAYVTTGMQLQIVNLANPNSPPPYIKASAIGTTAGTRAVAAENGYAYVGSGTSGITVLDVSEPYTPTQVSFSDTNSYGLGDRAKTISLGGGYAFVGGSVRLYVFNISNPLQTVSIDTLCGGAIRDSVLSGSYLYTAVPDYLAICDLTNLSNIHWESNPPPAGAWASGVAVQGSTAYLADATLGMRIYNIANSSGAYQVGIYNPAPALQYFTDVEVDGNVAYLTDWYGHKLHMVNVTNPAVPSVLGTFPSTGDMNALKIGRNPWIGADKRYAFIADGWQGARLLDVTDPANPSQVAGLSDMGFTRNIAVDGSYIFITSDDTGVNLLWALRDVVTSTITTAGGSLVSNLGDAQISFPSDAFSETVKVVYRRLWTDQLTGERLGIGHTFDLQAIYADNGQPASMQPGISFTAVLSYTNTGLVRENSLAIFGWEHAADAYTGAGVTSSVNTITNRVTGTSNHLSLFAVLGLTNRLFLPVTMK